MSINSNKVRKPTPKTFATDCLFGNGSNCGLKLVTLTDKATQRKQKRGKKGAQCRNENRTQRDNCVTRWTDVTRNRLGPVEGARGEKEKEKNSWRLKLLINVLKS